jgi:hypothetical protein
VKDFEWGYWFVECEKILPENHPIFHKLTVIGMQDLSGI